jgi:hypothetical protein
MGAGHKSGKETQGVGPLLQRIEHRPRIDRADGVKPELERSYNPEVAAPASDGPEEVLVLRSAGRQHPAIGGDNVSRD